MTDALFPQIAMPPFLAEIESAAAGQPMPDPAQRLALVYRIALANVEHRCGGPFGAAVFRRGDWTLFAAGCNAVVPSGQSAAHAEMTALARAEMRAGRFHLAREFELVSSCEPCVMCFGATLWSGVGSLLYGAPGEYARRIGFDEGDKVTDWHESLIRRGVEVHGPFPSPEAEKPFERYRELGGKIY